MNNQDNKNQFSSSNEQMEQTDYYNNDSYYENSNYSTSNYSDTTYEEKEKKGNKWLKILLLVLVILIIIILLLKFCGNSNSSSKRDEEYTQLTNRICDAAKEYIMADTTTTVKAGEARIVKFQALADNNLIETQIKNPYYDGGLFKKSEEPKYYSLNNSVRITMKSDGTYYCELVDNSKDVTAPELRLNGDAEITMAVGTEYVDPGYSATDDYDGDVTSKVVISGTVNNAKAGTYELTYTVSDTAGNTTFKKRTIIYEELGNLDISLGSVLDSVTPQISLKGANPYCMVKGGTYLEPGATATDNADGNITDKIAVTNKVTGNLMGAFRIVYEVEDTSGNKAIAYRAVIVTTSCPDNTEETKETNNAPVITLIGKNSVIINIGTDYVDLGATAYDKEDGDITNKLVTDTSAVNTSTAGIYKVWYRVTDSAGKTSSASRTVTVKNPNSENASVRFTEDKNNIEVYTGEGSDALISAPAAVNESNNAVTVTTKIENYETKKEVSSIDWSKAGKYRVIYTAVHGNGTIKQDKSIVVTIKEGKVTIGGKDAINVGVRSENCNITEADLRSGGVTFTTTSNKAPIVTITDGEDKACNKGTYTIKVTAKVDGGEETTKEITIYVVDDPNIDAAKLAPGKTQINTNSAVPYNPHNTDGIWVGGTTTAIDLMFTALPAEGTEIAHFEWSKDCKNATEQISKTHNLNEGTLSWKEIGKNEICIRAVSTDGIAGPWSDPVKLYLDRTGPSIRFVQDWSDEANSWHNTPEVTVDYVASDSESGLDHYEYTFDDVMGKKGKKVTDFSKITTSLDYVTVTEDTEKSRSSLFIYVRAVDKAGNVGEWTPNPAFVNIDTVKPNTPTITFKNNNSTKVNITAKAKDNESTRPSGIGMFIYSLDDGELKSVIAAADKLKESSKTFPIINTSDEDKTYKIKVWAVDKAGNRSDGYAEDTITVKKSASLESVQIKNGKTNINDGEACNTKELNVKGTLTLAATPVPTDYLDKTVKWESSDVTVATIDDDGKIKAIKAGEATIIATIGDKSSSCKLTVTTKATSQVTSVSDGGGYTSGTKSADTTSNNKYIVEYTKDSTPNIFEFATYEEAKEKADSLATQNNVAGIKSYIYVENNGNKQLYETLTSTTSSETQVTTRKDDNGTETAIAYQNINDGEIASGKNYSTYTFWLTNSKDKAVFHSQNYYEVVEKAKSLGLESGAIYATEGNSAFLLRQNIVADINKKDVVTGTSSEKYTSSSATTTGGSNDSSAYWSSNSSKTTTVTNTIQGGQVKEHVTTTKNADGTTSETKTYDYGNVKGASAEQYNVKRWLPW